MIAQVFWGGAEPLVPSPTPPPTPLTAPPPSPPVAAVSLVAAAAAVTPVLCGSARRFPLLNILRKTISKHDYHCKYSYLLGPSLRPTLPFMPAGNEPAPLGENLYLSAPYPFLSCCPLFPKFPYAYITYCAFKILECSHFSFLQGRSLKIFDRVVTFVTCKQ